MKLRKYSTPLLFLCLTACSDNEPQTMDEQVAFTRNTTYEVLLPVAQSRVAFDEDLQEGVKAVWSEGDTFELYDHRGERFVAMLNIKQGEDGAQSANFELDQPIYAGTYTAIYPRLPFYPSPNVYEQPKQVGNSSSKHLEFMCMMTASFSTEADRCINLNHTKAIVSLGFSAPDEYDVDIHGALSQIEFVSGDKSQVLLLEEIDPSSPIVVYSTFDPKRDDSKLSVTLTTESGESFLSGEIAESNVEFEVGAHYKFRDVNFATPPKPESEINIIDITPSYYPTSKKWVIRSGSTITSEQGENIMAAYLNARIAESDDPSFEAENGDYELVFPDLEVAHVGFLQNAAVKNDSGNNDNTLMAYKRYAVKSIWLPKVTVVCEDAFKFNENLQILRIPKCEVIEAKQLQYSTEAPLRLKVFEVGTMSQSLIFGTDKRLLFREDTETKLGSTIIVTNLNEESTYDAIMGWSVKCYGSNVDDSPNIESVISTKYVGFQDVVSLQDYDAKYSETFGELNPYTEQ